MSTSENSPDDSSRWKDTSVTVNATNCVISFFQPWTQAAPQTPAWRPAWPLPSIETGVKEEPIDSTVYRPSPNQMERFADDALPTLLKQFDAKRGFPNRSDDVKAPQNHKRRRLHDPFSTPKRDSSPILEAWDDSDQDVSDSDERRRTPDSEFYREHSNKLPQKQSHGKVHEWTFEEREAMCLLFMFYECDPEFKDIAKILNNYFSRPPKDHFRPGQLRAQWCTWRYVFRKRAIYNPERVYTQKKAQFEAAALQIGTILKPRNRQLKEKKLSPKFTKHTKKVAKNDAWFLANLLKLRNGDFATSTAVQASPLSGKSSVGDNSALAELLEAAKSTVQAPSTQQALDVSADEIDKITETTPTGSPYRPSQASAGYAPVSSQPSNQTQPKLFYRVYHDSSGGLNTPTRFLAGMFNMPGQSLVPPPGSSDILPVFASWHLWRHSVSSPFISCTDSLILALHKARQAERAGLHPHLSIIDATSLASAERCFHAKPLIVEARELDLVPGMRYKGTREWFVWGEIPPAAILHDLPFGRLRALTAADIAVADLLALDDVDPAPRTSVARIRKALVRQEVVLDASAGHAVGRLASLFGLGSTAPPPAVRQFVYDVFQGWALGAFEVEAMAGAFLAGLVDAEARGGAALGGLSDGEEGELREAFVAGVERAVEDLGRERRAARR